MNILQIFKNMQEYLYLAGGRLFGRHGWCTLGTKSGE